MTSPDLMPRTVALVEDTLDTLEVVRYFLKKHHPGLQIVGEARSVDEAYNLLSRTPPDLALLDIQIMGGTTFDVLARLNDAGHPLPELIFITAHGVVENATQAIRLMALDFIVKPIDEYLLSEAVSRALARLDAQESLVADVRSMLDQQARSDRFERITIRLVGGVRRLVAISELVYFQADREVTRVHLLGGEVLVAAVNIGYFKRMLQEDYDFLLIHQSLLVNAQFIREFTPRAGEVSLSTGLRLATSQTGMTLLKAYFERQEHQEPGKGNLATRLRQLLKGVWRGRG